MPNAQMLKCPNAECQVLHAQMPNAKSQMLKCQKLKCSNAQIPNAQIPNAQMLKCPNVQTPKAQMHKCQMLKCQMPNSRRTEERGDRFCGCWNVVVGLSERGMIENNTTTAVVAAERERTKHIPGMVARQTDLSESPQQKKEERKCNKIQENLEQEYCNASVSAKTVTEKTFFEAEMKMADRQYPILKCQMPNTQIPNAQMLKCSSAQIFKCSNAQMPNAKHQVLKCQMLKCANA